MVPDSTCANTALLMPNSNAKIKVTTQATNRFERILIEILPVSQNLTSPNFFLPPWGELASCKSRSARAHAIALLARSFKVEDRKTARRVP
jgi:hypothetical protein